MLQYIDMILFRIVPRGVVQELLAMAVPPRELHLQTRKRKMKMKRLGLLGLGGLKFGGECSLRKSRSQDFDWARNSQMVSH
jgi:hypothetical protein